MNNFADKTTMLSIRHLGLRDYRPIWRSMQKFTDNRHEQTMDEMWFVEHPPVYTQGQAGKAEHVIDPGDIPVVQVDRGGQVTYHGPGQLVVYLLLDIRRRKIGVRRLVELIEDSIIDVLKKYHVYAVGRPDAPGVYVAGAKIAALGLRVRKGCTFHGLSFNIDMDLEPFQRINPCGYAGMAVTQLRDLITISDERSLSRRLEEQLIQQFMTKLGYNTRLDFQALPR